MTRTVWPTRTSPAARSGTASCSRSGCWRTTVTTGVPAARYSPAKAWRSRTTPSIGERSIVSSSCWRASVELGTALREHGLPVAHFFERVLIAAFGDLQLRVGAFRDRRAPRCRAARTSRCDRAAAALRRAPPRLAHERRSSRSRSCRPRRAGSRPSRARACCSAASAWRCAARSRWASDARAPGRVRTGDPRSTSSSSSRPVTLRLSITCSSAASVPVTVIDRVSGSFFDADDRHRLGVVSVVAGARRGRRRTATPRRGKRRGAQVQVGSSRYPMLADGLPLRQGRKSNDDNRITWMELASARYQPVGWPASCASSHVLERREVITNGAGVHLPRAGERLERLGPGAATGPARACD